MQPNAPKPRMKFVIDRFWKKEPGVVVTTAYLLTSLLGQENNIEWKRLISAANNSYEDAGDPDAVDPLEAIERALDLLPAHHVSDFLIPWIAQQLSLLRKATLDRPRPDLETYGEAVSLLIKKGPVIAQWAKHERVDLGKVTLAQAFAAVADWQRDKGGVSAGTVVYKFADGYTMQDLPQSCLLDETTVMQHCVGEGGYDEAVESGKTKIYSLRDKAGRPHATIEWNIPKNRVMQVKGKQNEAPIAKYQKMVDEFLSAHLGTKELPESDIELLGNLDLVMAVPTDTSAQEDLANQWNWMVSSGHVPSDWIRTGAKDPEVARTLNDWMSPRDVRNSPFRDALVSGEPPGLIKIAEIISRGDFDQDEALSLAREWYAPEHAGRGARDGERARLGPEAWMNIGVFRVSEKEDWLKFMAFASEEPIPFDELRRWVKAFGPEGGQQATEALYEAIDDPSMAADELSATDVRRAWLRRHSS